MKLAISFTFSMLGFASIALADPADLDPNAHPLPPQAIGLTVKEPGPPPRMAATAAAATLPSNAPSGPCVRGQSQVRMGGIDIDEIKCELAVIRLERNAIQERLERILAAGSLVSSDLATARESTRQREAALTEWFKGYFGEPSK